jgi:hypothetical protein
LTEADVGVSSSEPSYNIYCWGSIFRDYSARQKPFGDKNTWNQYPPRYRFTQNHLRYIGTFADARVKPGWIFPTGAKILVNITQTDDMDTWIGQVEGCEERGMFFCTFLFVLCSFYSANDMLFLFFSQLILWSFCSPLLL